MMVKHVNEKSLCCNLMNLKCLANSFVSSSNTQTDITQVKKYGKWEYGPKSLSKIMPYIPQGDSKALLTTSDGTGADRYGTLVSKTPGEKLTQWIGGQMESPSVVWYWMKEAPSMMKGMCC